MDFELKDVTAVVTGASRGIGLAIVNALVREGAHVVAGARSSSPELDALAATGSVTVVPVDLGHTDGPARLIAAAGDRIDVLVNNVGLAAVRLGGFLEVTDEQWAASINLNLMAAVRTTRAALPVMLAAGKGSIVNIGSVNAFLPDPGVIDYSAAKAGLFNLAKSLSKEFGGRGIRVNTISPGPVSTALWLGTDGVAQTVSRASGQSAQEVADAALSGSVTKRFTTPQEVADLVILLSGARAANVIGAEFTIDGGLIATL